MLFPDCYWTSKGLSRLASVIGQPIGADDLTSKLEIMPFAKLCVQYSIGDPLPNVIKAVDLDPLSKSRSNVDVQVTYLNRPLICSGCQSIGHLVAACPSVSRIWVRKSTPVQKNDVGGLEKDGTGISSVTERPDAPAPAMVNNVLSSTGMDVDQIAVKDVNVASDSGGWTEVISRSKRAAVSSPTLVSPPLPENFKNLVNVDEIDCKLGKNIPSVRYRAKRALGVSPPQS